MRVAAFIGLSLAIASSASAAAPARGATRSSDWASHNSAKEDAYSALDQINRSNIKDLGLEWSLDLPGEQSLEATPLAVNGVLYFTGSHAKVYAVDAASGKLEWSYDPKTWQHDPAKLTFMFGVNRGAA